MKILICCDSFKGTLTSLEACQTIQDAALKVNPNFKIKIYPMADGGEGTSEIINHLTHGTMIPVETIDELGNKVTCTYSYNPNIAIIDTASCIGIEKYLKNSSLSMQPMLANSFGLGIVIKDAIHRGTKKIVIGLGGSATNDGGMGLLNAFGVEFLNKQNKAIRPSLSTIDLIDSIDISKFYFPEKIEIVALCDVENRYMGKNGATYIFGKQKGINEEYLEIIDKKLEKIAILLNRSFKKNITNIPGSGAAGGLGGVLLGIFNATKESGINAIMNMSDIEKDIKECDLVITGEGCTDAQTIEGKVPSGIARVALKYNKPVVIISGCLNQGYENLYKLSNIIGIYSTLQKSMEFDEISKNARSSLIKTSFSIIKTLSYFSN